MSGTPAFNFNASGTSGFGSTSNSKPLFGNTTFGSNNNNSTTPAFGASATTTTDPTKPAAATTPQFSINTNAFSSSAAPNAFTGVNFGNTSKPADNPLSSFSISTPAFGGEKKDDKPAAQAFSFGNSGASAKPATTGLFGSSTEKKDDKPATSSFVFGNSAAGDKPATTGLLFGGAATEKKDDKPAAPNFEFGSAASKDAKPAALGLSFGGASTEKKDDKPAALSFGLGSAASKDAKPATSGFSFGGASTEKKDDKSAAPTFGLGAAASKDAKPATSGFSFGGGAAEKKDDKPAATNEDKKTVTFTDNTKAVESKVVNKSITPQPISIKNKTLEDLITKWTNQLSQASKVFETYSDKVNQWDRVLVSSADKISQLYSDSVAAEQTQTKIDQTLVYIEKQQDELETLLNGYERQAESLLSSAIQSQPDTNANNKSSTSNIVSTSSNRSQVVLTNDQLRESSYRTAEFLENKLDYLGNNFQSLINEINEVSDTFNLALLQNSNFINDSEESIGQGSGVQSENGEKEKTIALENILRLLNNHLESLNWIEKNETVLKEKIELLKNSNL